MWKKKAKTKTMKRRRQTQNRKFHANIFVVRGQLCFVSFRPSSDKNEVRLHNVRSTRNKKAQEKKSDRKPKLFLCSVGCKAKKEKNLPQTQTH